MFDIIPTPWWEKDRLNTTIWHQTIEVTGARHSFSRLTAVTSHFHIFHFVIAKKIIQ